MKRITKSIVAVIIAMATVLAVMPCVLADSYTTKHGTKYIIDNTSLSMAYNVPYIGTSTLPAISYDCIGCDSALELGDDGETIVVTLKNWNKYSDDITCYIFMYAKESVSGAKTKAVEGVPIRYVTPLGTFDKYTDAQGRAQHTVERSALENIDDVETPSATATPEPTKTPAPTQTPTVTETPTPAETPAATATPIPTKTSTPTKTPITTEAPAATATPSPAKTPSVTKSPDASDTTKENGQTTTVDEYGNKHIVYDNGSEAFIYTSGREIVYDSSFTKAYDINDLDNNPLPKVRFLALRCSMEVKRDGKTGLITLTLSDYDEDLFDYVSLPEVIICEMRVSRDKQFWNTPIQGVPVKFITPDGTFEKYTDSSGAASFTKQRPGVTVSPSATSTPVPTKTPVPTSTPSATASPSPTKTPKPTEAPVPTKTPIPTKEPSATERPTPTEAPSNQENNRFRDVSASHWANDNINKITELGAFSGYEDGTFRPDNQITHEEFLKVAMSLIYDDEFDVMPENYVYLADNDVSSPSYWTNRWAAWAQPYLTAALDIGIVTNTDIDLGTAETTITRGEMAKIISRAVAYLGEEENADGNQLSSAISDWSAIPDEYRYYVAEAYSRGIIAGYSDGSFGSDKSLTRAEASAVVIRLIDKSQRKKDE